MKKIHISKRSKKILLIILMGVVFVNTVRVIPMKKDISANQENTVLYTTANGLNTFPYIFGERLYMYDIEKDKATLLKSCLEYYSVYELYYLTQNWLYVMQDNTTSYYNRQNIKNGKVNNWIPCDTREINGRVYTEGLISISEIIDEKEKLIFELDSKHPYTIDEYQIMNDNLYVLTAHDNDPKGELYIKNLKTLKSKKRELNTYYMGFNVVDNDNVILIDTINGKVDKYNITNKTLKKIAIFDKGKHAKGSIACYSSELRNNYLYFYNSMFVFYRLNIKTGQIKKLTEQLSEIDGEAETAMEVNYCKDYIALEAEYDNDKFLYVYDYNGNLIKKKKLKKGVY